MEEGEKARVCRYIALDIHKYYSVAAGVDRDGQEILPACRVEHMDLEDWLKKHLLPTDQVVIEVDHECLACVRSVGAVGHQGVGS